MAHNNSRINWEGFKSTSDKSSIHMSVLSVRSSKLCVVKCISLSKHSAPSWAGRPSSDRSCECVSVSRTKIYRCSCVISLHMSSLHQTKLHHDSTSSGKWPQFNLLKRRGWLKRCRVWWSMRPRWSRLCRVLTTDSDHLYPLVIELAWS